MQRPVFEGKIVENTACQTLRLYCTTRICKEEDVRHPNRQICCVFAAAGRVMSWTDSFWKSQSGFCGTFEAGQTSALSAATNALPLPRKYLSDDVNRLAVMTQSYCKSAGSWSYSWESSVRPGMCFSSQKSLNQAVIHSRHASVIRCKEVNWKRHIITLSGQRVWWWKHFYKTAKLLKV